MNTKLIASVLALAAFSTACNKSPNITTDSTQAQAEPFHGEVYRSFDGRTVLTLISRDECELRDGATTLLCKYTRQSDALRVVMTAMGTNQVLYYRFTTQGLQDNNGLLLLSPDRYAAAMEEARLEQSRQESMRREAEQKRLAEEARRRSEFVQRQTAFLSWLRAYFASGKTHHGARHEWRNSSDTYPYKFTVTMTADPKITPTDRRDEIQLEAFGKMHWLGHWNSGQGSESQPKYFEDQDQVRIIGKNISISETDAFGGFIYLRYVNSNGQLDEFSSTGNNCVIEGQSFKPNGGFILDAEATEVESPDAKGEESAGNQTSPPGAEAADPPTSYSVVEKREIFARAQLLDQKMASIYSRLRSRLSASGKARLKQEQLTWLKFRTEQTGSDELLSQGMAADTAALRRFTELDEERTSQLEANLQSMH